MGELINDPELRQEDYQIATDLETITTAIADGKGSLGKLINDDTLYTRANRPSTGWTRSPPIWTRAKAARASCSRTTRSITT